MEQQPSNNNEILFTQKDPLGHQIILRTNTMNYHIAGPDGDHPDRNIFYLPKNLSILQRVLTDPSYILKDKTREDRYNYIDLVMLEQHTSIKTLKIVTQTIDTSLSEIVTIFPMSSTSSEKFEGRVLYDRHGSHKG